MFACLPHHNRLKWSSLFAQVSLTAIYINTICINFSTKKGINSRQGRLKD